MKKEEYKDQGLRQALQRRNEAAEQMTLPEDFTDRLMERLEKPREGEPKASPIGEDWLLLPLVCSSSLV